VRKPSILLLDEATSALDNSSEAALLETLRHISRDTDITIIAVSHRMSFSNAANHIIVLRPDGVIDDQGAHGELLAREGLYATLWKCGQGVQPND
jgi:ABC-type multidrug transport system fused ATPase/permease subunit